MKKIYNILFILICFLFLFKIDVYAKDYIIEQANFEVELLEDTNDVLITENWELDFDGDFSRFYKDIYDDVTIIEEFSKIEVLDVTINGISCEQTYNNTKREDYTYYFGKLDDNYRIEWYLSTSKPTTYSITYKLNNVLKINENDEAVFCYRFVGKNFKKNINHIETTIICPSETIEVTNRGKSEFEIIDDTVIFTKNNHLGILKYRIHTDSELCTSDDEKKDINILLYLEENPIIAPFIFIGTTFFLIIFYSFSNIILGKFKRIKYNKILKNNPNFINELFLKYQEKHIMDFIFDFNISNNIKIFQSLLYYYINLGYIVYNPNSKSGEVFEIDKSIYHRCDSYDILFFKLIFSSFYCLEENNKYIIEVNSFISVLSNKEFIKQVKKIKSDYKPYKSKKNITTKKEKGILKWYLSSKIQKVSSNDLRLYLINNHYIPFEILLYNLYRTTVTQIQTNNSYNLSELFDFLNNANDILSSNSSGCSSCSSCSSCSGWGGGGAD